jgi:hypothetical protein
MRTNKSHFPSPYGFQFSSIREEPLLGPLVPVGSLIDPVSLLSYYSPRNLNITAVGSSETLDNTYQITQRHKPEDRILDTDHRENLKSHKIIALLFLCCQLLTDLWNSFEVNVSLPWRHMVISVNMY